MRRPCQREQREGKKYNIEMNITRNEGKKIYIWRGERERKEEKPHLHVCIKIKEMWRIFLSVFMEIQIYFFFFLGCFFFNSLFSGRMDFLDFKFIHLTFDSNRTSFLHEKEIFHSDMTRERERSARSSRGATWYAK